MEILILENVMKASDYRALVHAKERVQELYEELQAPYSVRRKYSDQENFHSSDALDWGVHLEREYGSYASTLSNDIKKWIDIIKEIRTSSRSVESSGFDKKVRKAVSRCRSVLSEVLYGQEGRTYDWHYDVNFISFDGDFVKRPDVAYLGKTYSGSHKCRMLVSPAWMSRVGLNRGCLTIGGKKAFMYDSEEFRNPVMNDQGVICYKASMFGIMGDTVFKHNLKRLDEELQDACASERGSIMDQIQELRASYEAGSPVKYSVYYLESYRLKGGDGFPVSAVGLTMDKAKALMDRRIKAESLKALGL